MIPIVITKSQNFEAKISEYGFFKLQKVVNVDRSKLVKLITNNRTPYAIALLDYLEFFHHLRTQYSFTEYRIHKIISNALEANTRDVKGNILVLSIG